MNKKRLTVLFGLLLLAGIAIRILYLVQYSKSPLFDLPLGPDVQEYDSWAKEILSGNFLWNSTKIHSPLYPFFLASEYRLFSSSFFAVRFFQLLIGILAFIPIGASTCLIHEKNWRRVFLLSFILWLFYPLFIYYQAELTGEILLVPLLCLSVCFLYFGERLKAELKTGRAVLAFAGASLCCGLSVLAHPIALFFCFFELIYLFYSNIINRKFRETRGFFSIFAYFAILILTISPLIIFNWLVLKEKYFLQANAGFNFYVGNNKEADGTCNMRPGPEWDRIHKEAEKASEASGISTDSYFLGKSFDYIKSNPFSWIELTIKKFFYVWNRHELTAGADLKSLREFTPFQRIFSWTSGLLFTLGLSGFFLIAANRNHSFAYRHFLILLISFWIAQTVFVPSGRYRVPMLPAVILFASFYLDRLIVERDNVKKLFRNFLPVFAAAAIIVYLPSPPFSEIREKAEAATLLGEAYLQKAEYDKAGLYLYEASIYNNRWSRNYNLLGILYQNLKCRDIAMEYFKMAAKCDPLDSDAPMNLGVLYSEKGWNEKAEKYFKEAMEIKKFSAELQYNYGVFLMKNGKLSEASEHLRFCLRISPAHRSALNNLGVLSMNMNCPSEAAAYFEKALRLDPCNYKIMVNLAAANFANGRVMEAKRLLKKVKTISPGCKEAAELGKTIGEE